jgi:hypothetical protein
MDFNQIRKTAKGMGINTYHMKKFQMIQAIQGAENNIQCFGTPRIDNCNEPKCMWRNDCISYSHAEIAKQGKV